MYILVNMGKPGRIYQYKLLVLIYPNCLFTKGYEKINVNKSTKSIYFELTC